MLNKLVFENFSTDGILSDRSMSRWVSDAVPHAVTLSQLFDYVETM